MCFIFFGVKIAIQMETLASAAAHASGALPDGLLYIHALMGAGCIINDGPPAKEDLPDGTKKGERTATVKMPYRRIPHLVEGLSRESGLVLSKSTENRLRRPGAPSLVRWKCPRWRKAGQEEGSASGSYATQAKNFKVSALEETIILFACRHNVIFNVR